MDNWDHESDTDVFVLFRGTKVLAPDRNNTENTFLLSTALCVENALRYADLRQSTGKGL
jgi:hypothetical protein